jgi:C4-dicarboxylate-binding protein DctP
MKSTANSAALKTLAAAAALSLVAFADGAAWAQAKHVIRLSHGMPMEMSSNQHAYAVVLKDIVEAGSKGEIEVRILGANQAGAERQQLEKVQNGTNQMGIVSEITQPFFFKPALVLGIPFLFPSSAVAWEVLDGPFGDRYAQAFQKDTGVRVINHMESGFRSIFNSKKPVKSPADLAGLKIRTGENPVHLAMVKALGANPTPIAWTEVYTSLQQKVVDGMENPPGLFFAMKFYEHQKYLTINRHLYSVHTTMVNEQFFQTLPKSYQQLVLEAAATALTIGRSTAFMAEKAAIENLKQKGIEIYTPTDAEFAEFRKLGRPAGEALVRKEIGDDWVNAAVKAVEDAEKRIRGS